MSELDETIIGGSNTCAHWRAFRDSLVPGADRVLWETAFEDYFRARIQLRYLNPIRLIQEHDTQQGEGFSIVAIHCTLVEFLESTVQGINYRYAQRDEDLGPHEYRKSGPVFVGFLCKREPFRASFTTEALAKDFYADVRCSLLHEARTRGGWRIWADGPPATIVDPTRRVLFRNNFHNALLQFIEWYRGALISGTALQEAFVRKFDSLCG